MELAAYIITQLPASGDERLAGTQTWTGANTYGLSNIKITGGANGQVLTTDGAGHLSWTTPSGGGGGGSGGRTLLNTLTASNVASVFDNTSITASYTEYELSIERVVPATSGDVLSVGFGSADGSEVQSIGVSGNVANAASGSNYPACGAVLRLSKQGDQWMLLGPTQWTDATTGGLLAATVAGFFDGTFFANPLQRLTFSFSSGNIASGVIKIYGLV